MNEPKHIDLFSGIGGFSLAASWAGFRTVAFVERELYCQKILAQHWPEVPVFGDIYEFDGKPFSGVELLTGGFPCQPFSQAGKRRGKEDDRYLWPEMLRVISEAKPHWVLGENVAGLDGLGLDDCISDLESIGYEVAPPLEIPACAVDARHVRNRIWIVANTNGQRLQKPWKKIISRSSEIKRPLPATPGNCRWPGEPGFCRVANGIPNRSHRLKALGNAIVPQVAFQIIKEIRKLI